MRKGNFWPLQGVALGFSRYLMTVVLIPCLVSLFSLFYLSQRQDVDFDCVGIHFALLDPSPSAFTLYILCFYSPMWPLFLTACQNDHTFV